MHYVADRLGSYRARGSPVNAKMPLPGNLRRDSTKSIRWDDLQNVGVGDGIRTRDVQIHSLALYQLSYTHRKGDCRFKIQDEGNHPCLPFLAFGTGECQLNPPLASSYPLFVAPVESHLRLWRFGAIPHPRPSNVVAGGADPANTQLAIAFKDSQA